MSEQIPHPDATTYRCVCGAETSLDSESATCIGCGRHYDINALRSAMAATAVLYPNATGQQVAQLGASDANDALIGRRLQHFRILSRLGSGGMGAVYRALDESLQRYVALKVIHNPGPLADDAGLQGVFQEARAQARVNHPNVAHIYYVGSDSDIPFLAMELVGDCTLADRMAGGPLPFHEVIRFGLQIAVALKHAAMFDIVHGDVKPTNVLLANDHTSKLSDFGLARRLSQSGASTIAAGTPEFVPPEVTLGQPANHRGDMYSLGVTLFKMTFGRLPYTPSSRDLTETLRLHRDADVEFPDPWPAELPQTWRNVLAKMLEKEPADRYDSFDELIADIKRHEPIVLPNASPMLRGFAWLFDGFLLSLPMLLLALVFAGNSYTLFHLARIGLQAAITFGICYLQAVWGTTPGKRLFQICIVDLYGLTPTQPILGLRATFQFVWAWASVVASTLALLRLSYVGYALMIGAALFIFVEMILIVFSKGRSIHDRLLRTRVVLDAAPQSYRPGR